jgi:hypothetical protein
VINKCAQKYFAYYSIDGKEKSIFYDENSQNPNNLKVSLLFKAKLDACMFQNSLSDLADKFDEFSRQLFFRH